MPTYNETKAQYRNLWNEIIIKNSKVVAKTATKILNSKARYEKIEQATGVPWFLIGPIHYRENSSLSFKVYLGNGQPFNKKTTIVPKGRGPFKSFEAGAVNALQYKKYDKIKKWPLERLAHAFEKWNGFGYYNKGKRSPYLWSGTNHYSRGKYVKDGVYDPHKVDAQLGCMALLKSLAELDPSVGSWLEGTAQPKTEPSPPPSKPKQSVPIPALMVENWALNKYPNGGEKIENLVARKGDKVEILDATRELWWKIRIVDQPDAATGWAPFTVIDVKRDANAIKVDFAKECIKRAELFGISGHYLMSVAHLRTKVTYGKHANNVDEGPFAISEDEWEAYATLTDKDVSSSMIVQWRTQCYVFALMTNHTQRALASLIGRQPNFAEVYLAQVIGSNAAAVALRDPTQTMKTLVTNISEEDVATEGIDQARIKIRYPELLKGTVEDAMVKIKNKLQKSMDETEQFILSAGGEVIPIPTSGESTDARQVDQHVNIDQEDTGEASVGVTPPPPPEERSRLSELTRPIALADIASDPGLAAEVQACLIRHGLLDPPVDAKFGGVSNWALLEFCSLNNIDLERGLTKSIARKLLQASRRPMPISFGSNLASRIAKAMISAGHWINRHPKCVNIVYVEGMNVDGTANDNKPNKFNDCRCLLSIRSDGKPRLVDIWDATTEPSTYFTEVKPMNSNGAARIAFGQYKAWTVGTYNSHSVLRQATDITVYRDLNRDYRRAGDDPDTGVFGIHQHWGYDYPKHDLGNSSAGCLVGRTKAGHKEFMKRIQSDPRYKAANVYRFVTTVVPVSKLPV